MTKISIILTTLNEEDHIEKIIIKIKKTFKNYEIIIVDDNSKDKTVSIIEQYLDNNVKLVKREIKQGLASAIARGVIESTGDYLAWLDVAMDYHIDNINNEIHNLKKNDIIVFSRYIKGGKDNRDKIRSLCSVIINTFAKILLTNKIKDYTGGLFLMNRSVLNTNLPINFGHGEYFIHFIYKCYLNNLKIHFSPIIYVSEDQKNSKTFKSYYVFLKFGLKYIHRIIITKLKI